MLQIPGIVWSMKRGGIVQRTDHAALGLIPGVSKIYSEEINLVAEVNRHRTAYSVDSES